jgi:hypothetical protein
MAFARVAIWRSFPAILDAPKARSELAFLASGTEVRNAILDAPKARSELAFLASGTEVRN